jgi:hypothetical protein
LWHAALKTERILTNAEELLEFPRIPGQPNSTSVKPL